MSMYSFKTGVTSILKKYSSNEREKAKDAVINRVRFETSSFGNIHEIFDNALNKGDYVQYRELISYIKLDHLDNNELIRIISDSRQCIHLLKELSEFVETILTIDWLEKDELVIQEFKDFYLTILVAHSQYSSVAISKLISHWIPNEEDSGSWENSTPDEKIMKKLNTVHKLLRRILNVIPMTFDIVIEKINKYFPYYKKPSFVVRGYIHNILWLLEYEPKFTEVALQLIVRSLIHLDVNAPRNEIEDCEDEVEVCDDSDDLNKTNDDENNIMSHPIAETLDVCMEKLFEYFHKFASAKIDDKNKMKKEANPTEFFQKLLNNFNNVILPSYNTHHVQFLIFYFCSFQTTLGEQFLNNLWEKVTNPNMPASIRQTSVGYMASFLARAKYLPLRVLKRHLSEMCSWAHKYILECDLVRTNGSLKANIVFFSVSQAIFYVIAFRSRDLTSDNSNLLFLQSLQLSAIVTCRLNPLKVCLSAVATAFAGVTRAHQLAYCHTILERNARKKLATVYNNEVSMPDECLETFFPFDPYLLKKSGKRIAPLFLKYQASEAEEYSAPIEVRNIRRKRGDSEVGDDIDDFIIDKKQKLQELSDHDKELQFSGVQSPD